MKKVLAISLSIFTILICVWLIIDRLDSLDIPSNKNDRFASLEKRKIEKRTDIDECEKQLLKNEIDFGRINKRQISAIAFQTQTIAFFILVLQLVLLVLILMMPKQGPKKIKLESFEWIGDEEIR